MNDRFRITVYTDASYCHQSGCGSWACYIKSAQGTVVKSGIFHAKVCNSTEAEMLAIANGIYLANRMYKNVLDKLIIVVTDCQSAIDILAHGWVSSKRMRSVRKKVTKQYKGTKVKYNKVKGHSKQDNPRTYVNNLVDKAARTRLKQARAIYCPLGK